MANWKFKKDAEPVTSDDFWYDLTDGGYTKPEDLLEEIKQVHELEEAIKTICSFQEEAEKAGLLIES